MSKQLQKLNYAPEEVEISVIGSSTPTTGSLTITQIKTLLASDQNYIKYTISASASEYLYFTNFTNNTAFYGADLYNATTSVYYRHLIKISYSSDLSSATWNYYNIPIITGSSSDLMTNPMTTQGDIIVGGASGSPARLGLGTAGQVLKVNSAGTGLEYGTVGGGGGGTQLYKHVFTLVDDDDNSFDLMIISTDSYAYETYNNVVTNIVAVYVYENWWKSCIYCFELGNYISSTFRTLSCLDYGTTFKNLTGDGLQPHTVSGTDTVTPL